MDDNTATRSSDFRSIAARIADRLRDDLITGASDPGRLELVQRSSETLAATSVASLGVAEVDPDLADQARAAVAVLAGLASASAEETATAVRRAVSDVFTEAVRIAVAALIAL